MAIINMDKMDIKTITSSKKQFLFFLGIKLSFFFLFIYLFIVNSWMNDDSYITFRMIDNFINGYGLRWNIAERVFINIHPLWMFLISFFYFFTGEPYFTTLSISFFLSSITLLLLWRKFNRTDSIIISSILLFSSKAFIDFCSSGLENPLSYFLCTLFFTSFLFLKNNQLNKYSIYFYFLLGTLCFLTRFDTILFYIPPLLFLLYSRYIICQKFHIFQVIFAIVPAIVWLIFSLIYYGFFFPNVYYAKLNTQIPLIECALQGIDYFKFSFQFDPITPFIIIAGAIIGIFSKDTRDKSTSLSIILYLLYIFKIGGCFMSGRFFALPFLVAIMLILKNIRITKRIILAFSLFFVLYNVLVPRAPINSGKDYQKKHFRELKNLLVSGVSDDRLYYHNASNLLHYDKEVCPFPNMFYSQDGFRLKSLNKKIITVNKSIGYLGYFSGPNIFIVDHYGLSDPLLARIPGKRTGLTGHNFRFIPEGYIKSLQIGKNEIKNEKLKKIYDKILIITRGDLFTWQRWRYILELNFGNNKYFTEEYQIDSSYN
jgi:arabinofuranosyltransferase